jgi:hypothetical protein
MIDQSLKRWQKSFNKFIIDHKTAYGDINNYNKKIIVENIKGIRIFNEDTIM